MTRPRFLKRRVPSAGDSDMDAAERAALMGKECPPEGNPFLHIRIELDVHVGNGNGLAVWTKHRKTILDAQQPGCRPAAFWVYDRTQPDIPEHFRTGEPSQQEQATYLHSHGLLASTERKKLPKDWFLPSTPNLRVIKNGKST